MLKIKEILLVPILRFEETERFRSMEPIEIRGLSSALAFYKEFELILMLS